jgi:hypothetical protein
MKGITRLGDLTGAWESWADLEHDRFRRTTEFSDGLVRATDAWNGKVAWSADNTGDVVVADSEQALADSRDLAWLGSFRYLFDPAPRTGFEVRADPITHRITRVRQLKGAEPTDLNLSAWKTFEGIDFPTQIEDESDHQTDTVVSVEIDRAPPAGIFEPPPPALTEVEFPAGQDSVTVDFSFEAGGIYLPVSIDGAAPEKFSLDTGAEAVISRRLAKKLGLNVLAAGIVYGGGPGATPKGLARISRIQLAGLTLPQRTIQVADGPVEPGVGLLGYELLRRTIVSIDYARRRITFAKPGSFHPPADAIALPFRFGSIPEILVEAEIDGQRGEFQIDTGQGLPLTVNRPFAQRTGLLAHYAAGKKSKAVGFGGKAKLVQFTPTSFSLAGFSWTPNSALLFLDQTGGNAEEFVAGQIGNAYLQLFHPTFDYANRVLYLEKPSIESMDRTIGGWLGLAKARCHAMESCEVLAVDPGTPAARAGIRKGDRILAPLPPGFSGATPPGAEFNLTLKRGNRTWTVTLKSI